MAQLMPDRPVARILQPGENGDAAISLARAFQNEPGFSYVIPDAGRRQRKLPAAFHMLLKHEQRRGIVFATEGLEAVTLWRPPGQAHDNFWQMARIIIPFARQFGLAAIRGLEVADAIKAHLPVEPFWYLHYAGCHPDFQGKGFGGAAIRAGLSRADADGLPAYLETADPDNIPLYRAFGFDIVSEWQIPEGPVFWGMKRPGATRH